MKEGGAYKKLGEIAKVQNGFAFDSKLFNENKKGTPLIRIRDIKRGYSYTYTTESCSIDYNVENGDLLIGMDGDFNVCVWKGEHAYLNQRVCRIVPSDAILARYLFYLLPFPLKRINDKTTYATVKHLSAKQVLEIDVPNIPLSEQQRIVKQLDETFAEIDTIKAAAEKQLSEAKALFQKALSKAMTPKEGWEEKTLPDISENLDSLRVPVTKKNRLVGKYPYYGASGIVDYIDDYLFDEDLLCISEDGANLLMRTYPIAFPVSGKVWVNNHAHVLRFRSDITQRYIEYFINGQKIDEYITGAAQPKLTQKALNNIKVDIPSKLSDQQRIVEELDELAENVKEIEKLNNKLAAECDAMKQALLRQVFE